jgi:predicted  nucleic acid-binding Zn-ribbon protein
MHSLFEYFQKFRDWFNGNDEPEQEDLVVLLERIQKMAVDLTQLVQEVDRVRDTQEKATALITSLVAEVKSATDQLVAKTAEAENTVDVTVINELVSKLKASTDSLTAVLPAPPAQ